MSAVKVHPIEHIGLTPGKRGGRPRIVGAGVSVETVVRHHKAGTPAAEVAERYDLTLGQVYAALSYYYDHLDEVETALARNEEDHHLAQANTRARQGFASAAEWEARQALGETDFISTREAARRLKKSEEWVRSLCREGRLTAVRVGRVWLIRPEGLDAVRDLKVGYPKGRPRRGG